MSVIRRLLNRVVVGAGFVLLIAAACPVASAKDIYVNNFAGDDLFDGSAPESSDPGRGPYRTIRRALKAARGGDRIVLAKTDEPYRESVSLVGSTHSGTSFTPFVIEGNGAILDGSQPVPDTAWEFVGGDVFRFQPGEKAFQQLYLGGKPAARKTATNSGVAPELEANQWALVDGWVYFCVEKGKLPNYYNLSYAVLPVGITLYKVDHVVISNLTVQGYALDGIHLNDAVGPTMLGGLTARGNGRSGVAVSGASNVIIDACLLGDNGLCQVHVDGYSDVRIENSDVLENSGPKWEVAKTSRLVVADEAPPAKP